MATDPTVDPAVARAGAAIDTVLEDLKTARPYGQYTPVNLMTLTTQLAAQKVFSDVEEENLKLKAEATGLRGEIDWLKAAGTTRNGVVKSLEAELKKVKGEATGFRLRHSWALERNHELSRTAKIDFERVENDLHAKQKQLEWSERKLSFAENRFKTAEAKCATLESEKQQTKKDQLDVIFIQAGFPTKVYNIQETTTLEAQVKVYAAEYDLDADTLMAFSADAIDYGTAQDPRYELEPSKVCANGADFQSFELRKVVRPQSKRKVADSGTAETSKKQKV